MLLQTYTPKHLSLTEYYSLFRDIRKPSKWHKHGLSNCFSHTFNVPNDHSSYFQSLCMNYLKWHGSNSPRFRKENLLTQIKRGKYALLSTGAPSASFQPAFSYRIVKHSSLSLGNSNAELLMLLSQACQITEIDCLLALLSQSMHSVLLPPLIKNYEPTSRQQVQAEILSLFYNVQLSCRNPCSEMLQTKSQSVFKSEAFKFMEEK